MAKDKSKKSTIADDDFARPSDAPAGGDGWKLADDDNDGKLFLITPLRTTTVTTEKYGEKEVIVADVVALNEKKPGKSEEHEEVYVFGAWLQGSLRGYIGERRVLCRLVKEDDKSSGRGYVWKFEDGDADDIAVAREYLASLDPFATKKGSKADDEKPAKGKKSKAEPEPKAGKKKSKK
ncbi:hypothetical protein QEH40_gp39 [Microbacterium phage OscarSo]|uniref:Uncharacterized protein n=1 Tax=Microbacterium phage OscarSo TaxID=2985324 RepID=A0A9X9P651_9CAUD|nr:hypothetical protein QEH40_gp39 [Microbacterium phage OscarSo]UYL87160.1 hypothetical protein SEA_OSCARSO_39 [Microbacterium phage OscarSo]